MRRLLGAVVLLAVGLAAFAVWRAVARNAPEVACAESPGAAPQDAVAVVVHEAEARGSHVDVGSSKAGGPAVIAPVWWDDLPRTDEHMYRSFAVNPLSVQAKQLLRNSVLNPADLRIDRAAADAFCAYYEAQHTRVSQARTLVEEARMRLVQELLARGDLMPVTVQGLRERSFEVSGVGKMSGDELIERVRESLGEGCSDDSVTMNALTMAGLFGAGDTMTFTNNQSYLLSAEQLEQGIPEELGLERSLALEMVTGIHGWFAAAGLLPDVEKLLEQIALRAARTRK